MYILTDSGRTELMAQGWTARDFAAATKCHKDQLARLRNRLHPKPFGPAILNKLRSFFHYWQLNQHYQVCDSSDAEIEGYFLLRHGDNRRLPSLADREDLTALYAAMLTSRHIVNDAEEPSAYDSGEDFDSWFDNWEIPPRELTYEPIFLVRKMVDPGARGRNRVISFLYGDRRKPFGEVEAAGGEVRIEGRAPVPRLGLFPIWYLVGEGNNWLPGNQPRLSDAAKSRVRIGERITIQTFVMLLLKELRHEIQLGHLAYLVFEVEARGLHDVSRLRLFHSIEKEVRHMAMEDLEHPYIRDLIAYVVDCPYFVPRESVGDSNDSGGNEAVMDDVEHRLVCVPLTEELQRAYATGSIPFHTAETLFANVLEMYYHYEDTPVKQEQRREAIAYSFNRTARQHGSGPVRCLTIDQHLMKII